MKPRTGPTQRVHVADTYNNRILGFRDLRQVTAGAGADLVIGQPDGQTSLYNYPTGDPAKPAASSLCGPVGLVVDSGTGYTGNEVDLQVVLDGMPSYDRFQKAFRTKIYVQ